MPIVLVELPWLEWVDCSYLYASDTLSRAWDGVLAAWAVPITLGPL